MKIIDLNGLTIVVDDLEKAIQQAGNFKDWHHVPPCEADLYRQHYWRDIYDKLIQLKLTEDRTKTE